MASGDALFQLFPHGGTPPIANYATNDYIIEASTPGMEIPSLDFDGAVNEHNDWCVIIPSWYSGVTGFTFQYYYATDGADPDLVEMQFRVLYVADLDVLTGDLGMDTQTAVAIQDTPPASPTNKMSYSTTGTLAKAEFGSAGAGAYIIIRSTRNIAAATNTDDFQLLAVYVTET